MANTLEENNFNNTQLNVVLIGISASLALVQTLVFYANFYFSPLFFFFSALLPLAYLAKQKCLRHRYALFALLFILMWSIYIFIYHNTLVWRYLPTIVLATIGILYLTSMHQVKHFKLYKRILISLLITLPFFWLVLTLLRGTDAQFDDYINNMLMWMHISEPSTTILMCIYFLMYLMLFIYSRINHADRSTIENPNSFDSLVLSIFLSSLNILFFEILLSGYNPKYKPFFAGVDYIQKYGISPADFARDGFYGFVLISGFVVMIFSVITRRYKVEMGNRILISAFMAQIILIGVVSIQKMYLYQMIYGVTSLRSFAEWFEYFLIVVLLMGIFLTLFKFSFYRLLDSGTLLLGLIAFSLVVSFVLMKLLHPIIWLIFYP